MRLYFAGPLFTRAERDWNLRIAARLAALGHDVFLPQEEVQNLATLQADTVFNLDVDGLRSADVLVAVLDGADADSGTAFECGLAYALGLPIVVVRTDFRGGGDALPGQALGTINLMLSQAASALVVQTDPGTSEDHLIASLDDALSRLPTASKPVERRRDSS
jgi:nucleoside 2-deoxyribosyltransferase